MTLTTAEQQGGGFSLIIMLLVYAVFIGALYLIFFRPQNKKKKKEVLLQINAQGLIVEKDWEHIAVGSVKLYTGHHDCEGNLLYQDDSVFHCESNVYLQIRYGEFEIFNPESHQWENTVGFYLENEDEEAFPLGNPEERLRKAV